MIWSIQNIYGSQDIVHFYLQWRHTLWKNSGWNYIQKFKWGTYSNQLQIICSSLPHWFTFYKTSWHQIVGDFLPLKSYQEFISFAFFKFSKAKNFLTLSKITFWLVKYNPYITPDNYEQMSDEFRKAVKVGESLAVFSKDPQRSLADVQSSQDLIFVAITLLVSLHFSLSKSFTMAYTITPSHSFSPSISVWLSLAWSSILWFVMRPWQHHTPPVAFHIAKTKRALSQSQTMCLNSITRMGDGLGNWYVFQVRCLSCDSGFVTWAIWFSFWTRAVGGIFSLLYK